MRGSAAFRAAVAPGGVLAGPWAPNELWRRAKAVPSLDLRFAENKSLVDATTGQNLVTFTRASSGTYVGSDGVIKTATTNLLTFSEQFDNAAWTKQSSVSVSANAVTAPNGTLTADTITADSGLGIYQSITSVVGLNYVNSVYVKAGTATSLFLRDDTGAGRHIQFNPSTGQITATSGTLLSSGSQAVGDGWFRVWMIYAADATTVRGIIRPTSSGSAQTFTVWGAQLEANVTTVGEYIPTTSVINSAPRFDHNPTTGESLGLLVEEARTNSLLYSEQFDNAYWTKTSATVVANAIAAPNGTLTGAKLITSNTLASGRVSATVTLTIGASATLSCFAKQGAAIL
ncbi:hypothetical protein EBT31_16795, partial [bacterium]|nr:hypothetical protein [bacterium]